MMSHYLDVVAWISSQHPSSDFFVEPPFSVMIAPSLLPDAATIIFKGQGAVLVLLHMDLDFDHGALFWSHQSIVPFSMSSM